MINTVRSVSVLSATANQRQWFPNCGFVRSIESAHLDVHRNNRMLMTTHNAGRVRPQTSKSSTQQQAGSLNTSQSHKHRALVVRVNIYIFFSLVITQENSLCVRLVFSNSWFPCTNKLSTVMFIYKLHWISKALWNPLWLIMAELCVSVWSHAIFSFKISLKLIW